MAEDFSELFQEAFWQLRMRRVSGWGRIIAEELLLRTWGENRPHLHIRKLELIAGLWGLSRGNVHEHLDELLRLNIINNDARAAMAARLGKDWQKSAGARPDKDAQFWWFNETGLWDVRPRVDPDSPASRRAAQCDAALRDDNPEQPGQMHLAGFEEQTGGEVQADAALARAESSPTAGPSAAASSPASLFPRSSFWNQTGSPLVPESRTVVPESRTPVPESRTEPDNLPNNARARPGSQEQNSQASQAAQRETGKPGAKEGNRLRQWRPLTAPEVTLRDEIEAWCIEGGDDPAITFRLRPALEVRIRGYRNVLERAFRDVQLGVREGRDVVRKTRGGLLKCRFEEFLLRQPPKMHGPLKAASRPALCPTVPIPPPLTPEEEEQKRAAHRRMLAEMKARVGGGAN